MACACQPQHSPRAVCTPATTCSQALHLLHVLSTAEDVQRSAVQVPRVVEVAARFIVPEEGASGYATITCHTRNNHTNSVQKTADYEWSAPVLHSPDKAARLLLAQLFLDGNSTSAGMTLTLPGTRLSTGLDYSSPGNHSRVGPVGGWCSDQVDSEEERGTGTRQD